MSEPINTHGLLVEFGKHKGEPWTRVPVGYLFWLVNESGHPARQIAEAELARRGSVRPKCEISGHAVDTASLRVRKRWHETRGPHEGLHAWLVRMVGEAMETGETDAQGRYVHNGIKLAIANGSEWPVLKTVMRAKRDTRAPEGIVE